MRVNGTFLRWTGYTPEQIVGVLRLQDLLTPGGKIYHETHYMPLLRMQGSVREIAVDIVSADGRRLPVLLNSVLLEEQGVVRTMLLDARERRAYERELRAGREEARTIAHTLQQSLIAGDPPRDPRYTVATLYRPAVEGLEVGGDWHDAFTLADGKVAIVVGDVVGRGLTAATAMGQLRSAVRALALTGLGPERVTRALDAFVERDRAAQFATVAYAEIEPDSGAVALAVAGHPPPVLLDPGGTPELFMGGRSTPLGVVAESLPRAEARFTLAPGGGVLLYTDGLVERRGEDLMTGLERLVTAAGRDPSPAALAAALDQRGGGDDVCVLRFSRTPR